MSEKALKRIVGWIVSILRALFIMGISYIILFPLLYAISNALKPTAQMLDPTVVWFPKSFTLDNFKIAWVAMDYGRSVFNTIYIQVISAILQVVSCSLAGYSFARFHFKGQGLLFGLVILTMAVPPQVFLVPLYASFADMDFLGIMKLLRLAFPGLGKLVLLDTPMASWLPALLGVGLRSGFMIFIYRQFFRNVPRELEEAAWIDGAGPVKAFVKIVIPSVKVAVLVVFIFSMIWYWNEYIQSALLFDKNQPLAVRLVQLQDGIKISTGIDTGLSNPTMTRNLMMAGVFLFIAPVLIVYTIVQKYFIQGIEHSGLVG